ncbi:aerolysin family beta-barrel pore-forming toxin [Vibrio jasicida]|uniref:aerolysin family beta-barrel pore-forming toxin n=1 Tax=Vibrio jasicida TaxID=766224 RepID=UPI000CE56A0D|nr:aerolysin family beta-barrel pore-forming toxin [Vibrio jasicida]NOJ17370.1 aerolysin family beta-barrel pore-forming toxin [Vibrio jasicida]
MLHVSTPLSITLALSFLSTFAQAKIYSDQLVIDELENHQCRSDYRQLTYQEAQEHKTAILSRMQTWDIVGLESGWAIMGSGYHGQIKPEQSSHKTWCYPIHPNTELPKHLGISIAEGSKAEIEYELVSNQELFIRPVSYLAHTLGYAWLSGNGGNFVGEDMVVNQVHDGWEIQGNNAGACNGERCSEKTKITASDFAYQLNPHYFSHGNITESTEDSTYTITAYAINTLDQAKQIHIQFDVEQIATWSKTDNSAFAQSVHISSPFQWPTIGTTSSWFIVKGNQAFSDLTSGTSTLPATREANLTVPARSILPIRIELSHSRISYPFRFRADISYRVNFDGFLRYSGNAWHAHPKDRPTISHTFTLGRASELKENIRYQWDHRYIPGETKWWDWSWAIHNHGLPLMQYAAGATLQPYYSHVSGLFDAESQQIGMIDVGRELAVDTPLNWDKNAHVQHLQIGDISVVTDFDSSVLDRLGFRAAHLLVQPIN